MRKKAIFYAIICDIPTPSFEGVDTQILVDRDKIKDVWWTYNIAEWIYKIPSFKQAEYMLKRFTRNNPRIVSIETAIEIAERQNKLTAK